MVLTAEVKQLSNAELEEIALGWVNDLRTEYGEERLTELPQGLRCHPGSCVMAAAVMEVLCDGSATMPRSSRYGDHAEIQFGREGRIQTRPVPKDVEEFMKRFDNYEYPHLVRATVPTRQSVGVFSD